MRNQISGSISLDVSSLADAIAERLNRSAAPALTEASGATLLLAEGIANTLGLQDTRAAAEILRDLRRHGYVLAKLPDPTEDIAIPTTDWFQRTTD